MVCVDVFSGRYNLSNSHCETTPLCLQSSMYWLNLVTTSSVGSSVSNWQVFRSLKCWCASSTQWDVFMTTVVSPLSALVTIMSLFFLRRQSAFLSALERFCMGCKILSLCRSQLIASNLQSMSLIDLVGSLNQVLYICFSSSSIFLGVCIHNSQRYRHEG